MLCITHVVILASRVITVVDKLRHHFVNTLHRLRERVNTRFITHVMFAHVSINAFRNLAVSLDYYKLLHSRW